jgi:UDP-N-acetyl-2-amino-2-deoxyglucuronate dehydrogenase
VTNIGVHFFDVLLWIFGGVKENIVNIYGERKAAGCLKLERASVRWLLSLDSNDLPGAIEDGKPKTYRSITVDGKDVEFSSGFSELHTESYRRILSGEGFRPKDVLPSIQVVSDIRSAVPVGLEGDYHPMLSK